MFNVGGQTVTLTSYTPVDQRPIPPGKKNYITVRKLFFDGTYLRIVLEGRNVICSPISSKINIKDLLETPIEDLNKSPHRDNLVIPLTNIYYYFYNWIPTGGKFGNDMYNYTTSLLRDAYTYGISPAMLLKMQNLFSSNSNYTLNRQGSILKTAYSYVFQNENCFLTQVVQIVYEDYSQVPASDMTCLCIIYLSDVFLSVKGNLLTDYSWIDSNRYTFGTIPWEGIRYTPPVDVFFIQNFPDTLDQKLRLESSPAFGKTITVNLDINSYNPLNYSCYLFISVPRNFNDDNTILYSISYPSNTTVLNNITFFEIQNIEIDKVLNVYYNPIGTNIFRDKQYYANVKVEDENIFMSLGSENIEKTFFNDRSISFQFDNNYDYVAFSESITSNAAIIFDNTGNLNIIAGSCKS